MSVLTNQPPENITPRRALRTGVAPDRVECTATCRVHGLPTRTSRALGRIPCARQGPDRTGSDLQASTPGHAECAAPVECTATRRAHGLPTPTSRALGRITCTRQDHVHSAEPGPHGVGSARKHPHPCRVHDNASSARQRVECTGCPREHPVHSAGSRALAVEPLGKRQDPVHSRSNPGQARQDPVRSAGSRALGVRGRAWHAPARRPGPRRTGCGSRRPGVHSGRVATMAVPIGEPWEPSGTTRQL